MARKHRISDIEHYGSSAMGRNKREGFLMYRSIMGSEDLVDGYIFMVRLGEICLFLRI